MILPNRRIFIIEDDLANRAIVQIALEQEGAKTAIERWGVDAVQRIERFLPVDIILLDLMFPNNISGFDVFLEIRENAALRDIPIVAVSAAEPIASIAKAKEYGFDGFIAKPIDTDHFPQQIANILDGESLWLAQSH